MFSYMRVFTEGETHLTNAQQTIWIDNIILSVLRQSCSEHVLQHHLCSFTDVSYKTHTKCEFQSTEITQVIDIQYTVLKTALAALWDMILKGCNQSDFSSAQMHSAFKNLFLMISDHDLKLHTKHSICQCIEENYLCHLNICFCFELELFSDEDCWLNLEMKNTPLWLLRDNCRIILLCRTECLNSWCQKFMNLKSECVCTQEILYLWWLSCNVLSVSVHLTLSNSLWKKSLIMYNKIYNLHKDLFMTLMKNCSSFNDSDLEDLSFSQKLLDSWYIIEWGYNVSNHAQKWAQLMTVYQHIKNQLLHVLTVSSSTNFEICQEYCICVDLLQYKLILLWSLTLTAHPSSAADSGITEPHAESESESAAGDSTCKSCTLTAVNVLTQGLQQQLQQQQQQQALSYHQV